MSFISKDFLNADANCPDYVITAFEIIEMLKTQGAEGKMNHDPQSNVQCKNQKIGFINCVILILNYLNNLKENE